MARYFLRLWVKSDYAVQRTYFDRQVGSRLTHTSLRVSGGQDSGVGPGDYVYVIFWKNGTELYLIGRMRVDCILNQKEAAEYLNETPDEIFQAREHAVATKEDSSVVDFERVIPGEVVKRLVVWGKSKQSWHPLIYRKTGKLEQRQFQGGIREFHAESAKLLDALIDADSSRPGRIDGKADRPSHVPERVWRAIKERRGQRDFRQSLMMAYGGRCAITGCNAEAALEAAHIRDYAATGSHDVANGLLLRADIHTLFDLHLIQIEPDSLKVILDSQLQGTCYVEHEGKRLTLPHSPSDAPDKEALRDRWERAHDGP